MDVLKINYDDDDDDDCLKPSYLVIQRQDKYAADFDQIPHVVLVLRRTGGATVESVVLATVRTEHQTVPSRELRLTKLEFVERLATFDEPRQFLFSILYHVRMVLHAVIDPVRPWKHKQIWIYIYSIYMHHLWSIFSHAIYHLWSIFSHVIRYTINDLFLVMWCHDLFLVMR